MIRLTSWVIWNLNSSSSAWLLSNRIRLRAELECLVNSLTHLHPYPLLMSILRLVLFLHFSFNSQLCFCYRRNIHIPEHSSSLARHVNVYKVSSLFKSYPSPCLGNNLPAKGFGYQWERTWAWSSRHDEELWGSFCFLLPSPTHGTGTEVG